MIDGEANDGVSSIGQDVVVRGANLELRMTLAGPRAKGQLLNGSVQMVTSCIPPALVSLTWGQYWHRVRGDKGLDERTQ